jgi:hypothetical protein
LLSSLNIEPQFEYTLIFLYSLIPNVLWAQRSGTVYVTIDVPDITGEKIVLEANKVHFSGKSGTKEYAVDLELLHEIDAEVCFLFFV